MAKALPLKLWLELEDDVARHQAELAQAFAEARERLLPEPPEPTRPWGPAFLMLSPAEEERRGLFGLGVLGL